MWFDVALYTYALVYVLFCCFFFNDTATTEIYTYGHTLSLHDALPISAAPHAARRNHLRTRRQGEGEIVAAGVVQILIFAPFVLDYLGTDRKSTRLNSSH